MSYVKRLSKELLRSISLALLLALILNIASAGIVRADDPTWTQTSQADFNAGTLFQIDTAISPGQLTIEIRNTTGVDYRPGSTVYASLTTSVVTSTGGQEYQFNFTSPAAVTSGTHYAIVLNELTGVGGGGKYYWDEYTPSDIYPNGNVWRSSDSGSSWSVGGGGVHDFYFKTYVSGAQYYSNEVHLSKLKEAGSF